MWLSNNKASFKLGKARRNRKYIGTLTHAIREVKKDTLGMS